MESPQMLICITFLTVLELSICGSPSQVDLRLSISREIPEDAKLFVPALIRKYGYPCETYYVTTEDNYILALHRIPHGKESGDNPQKGKPFFIQHGLLSSSADWLITGPGKGLGYILADAGYDVWMGNFRGNRYSRNHSYLDPNMHGDKFWNFSWHEMGIYDLPAMIDYILGVTEESKLLYAGHSQGTTTFYVMCSERPEYNDKIIAHFSLAPIAFMSHMTSPLLRFVALGRLTIAALSRGNEFLPKTKILTRFGNQFCDKGFTQTLCTNSLFIIMGFSKLQMNSTLLPVLMGHTPAGASTKQVAHYIQEIKSGHFRSYDYTTMKNLRKYSQVDPPDYNLTKITAPIYLIYSHNDWLADEVDIKKLQAHLKKSVVQKYVVPYKRFNHLDYLFGIDAPKLIYSKILNWASQLP